MVTQHQAISVGCKARDSSAKKHAMGFVYGSNDGTVRQQIWNDILQFTLANALSLLVVRDYNSILYPNEKTNGHTDDNRILSKIDRVIVNLDWVSHFSDSKADFLEAGISDHSPVVVVSILENRVHGPSSFKLFKFMTEEVDFMDLVRSVWEEPVRGNPMFVIITKLKRVKSRIILWKKKRFKNIHSHFENAKVLMNSIQQHIQHNPLCVESAQQEKSAMKHYAKVAKYEESVAKHKSRVKWIDLGDSNTHFFHNSTKERYSRNNILTLLSRQNVLLQEDTEIAAECIDFYYSMFDNSSSTFVDDQEFFDSINFESILSDHDKTDLVRPITRDEVVLALSSIGSRKSPGMGFLDGFLRLVGIISLRMKHVLGKLINSNQSAFISGRTNQDNVFLAHELLRNYHRTIGSPRCALKIDLKKDYDTWISSPISSSRFSTMINGSPYGFFGAKRGLRQGCPLSPYLFVMVMEILSVCLKKQVEAGDYGLHPKCHQTALTHLCFADDVLVFCKGDLQSTSAFNTAIQQFIACSSLEVSKEKSSSFSSAVNEVNLQNILSCLDCGDGDLPVRYLGLTLLTTRLSFKDCISLIDKVTNMVQCWKYISLTYAGRLALIKHVLHGMVFYWLSCFTLPKKAIHCLNSIFKRFLCAGATLYKKTNFLISWDNVCTTYKEGGLAIRDIQTTNEAAGMRHIWELVSEKESVCTDWIKSNLIKDKDFWSLKCPQDAS
ncbi:uncharacterized protein LOC113338529 [Papaver somniferum]|uniref:uncharacterized protein LOC113338529 n=1 Tax=Papaver somniferum TaxID=3469 RepID=UPI000E7045C4|nr:uncharacterized protein LOC113338529 [Papaver somniferum]